MWNVCVSGLQRSTRVDINVGSTWKNASFATSKNPANSKYEIILIGIRSAPLQIEEFRPTSGMPIPNILQNVYLLQYHGAVQADVVGLE